MKEEKYYSFQDILNFLSYDFKFDTKSYGYPFTKGRGNVTFSWGQILIPKTGILEMVQNKISDINERPLSEINMMYQIPYSVENKDGSVDFGIINENISLSFRYDKTYKYGDISKSIYEVCFAILQMSKATNDFYIIDDDCVQEFFSYYICNNQWGLGSTVPTHNPTELYYAPKNKLADECEDCIHLEDDVYCCSFDGKCTDRSAYQKKEV